MMRPSRAVSCVISGARIASNENKMSDGGRERASLAVEMWKSSQEWVVQRSAVRSIAWLGVSSSAESVRQTRVRQSAANDGLNEVNSCLERIARHVVIDEFVFEVAHTSICSN
jgi:hypothetical protein